MIYGGYGVPYNVRKKSAECALVRAYPDKNAVFPWFPYITGADDYTGRLYFYVQHILDGIPMYIDNMDSQMSFINVEDAGRFLLYLASDEVTGAINGASSGTVSLREIIAYVEKKTGHKAVLARTGDIAPYNETPGFSINTEKAKRAGFEFLHLKDWLYDLLDHYIEDVEHGVNPAVL